jgi:hypothetical protein
MTLTPLDTDAIRDRVKQARKMWDVDWELVKAILADVEALISRIEELEEAAEEARQLSIERGEAMDMRDSYDD